MSKIYPQPVPPDMLPNGHPKITMFRARQVVFDPAERHTEPVVTRPRHHIRIGKRTFSVLLGVVMFIGLPLFWSQVVVPTANTIQDQWNYGTSRITQLDADVGHGGECHFIAEYYKGAIVVIEVPFANPNNTHTYTIPGIAGNGSTPVILLSTTKNGQTGRVDLVVQVSGTNFETVLYNAGSAFSENQ